MTSANRPFDFDNDAATVLNSSPESPPPECGHWKILIVDDEEDIHSVTRLALRGFTIEDRKLIILNAYSAHEAQTLIVENPDIAVILLDVVMETTHAGLDLVSFIRTDRKNSFVRIILRTGQPGEAPELAVMEQLKIDDYRLKTELTHDKLQAVLMASIRTYDAMIQVEKYRQNLEKKV